MAEVTNDITGPRRVRFEVDANGNHTLIVKTDGGAGVADDTGAVIFPESMAQSGATYDANGSELTRTITDGTNSWVRTSTYDAQGNRLTRTGWVRV